MKTNDFDDELAALNTAFDAFGEATDLVQPDTALCHLLYLRFREIQRAIIEANPALKIIVDHKGRWVAIPAA